jgi:hypothetical protein
MPLSEPQSAQNYLKCQYIFFLLAEKRGTPSTLSPGKGRPPTLSYPPKKGYTTLPPPYIPQWFNHTPKTNKVSIFYTNTWTQLNYIPIRTKDVISRKTMSAENNPFFPA